MRITEARLRRIIRSELLSEAGGSEYVDDRRVSSRPAAPSRETNNIGRQDVSDLLESVNKLLLAADIVMLGFSPVGGSGAVGAKVLGIVGGTVNIAQSIDFLTQEPPQKYEAAWSFLTGIMSIITTPQIARTSVKVLPTIMDAGQNIEQFINRKFPGGEDDTRRQVERALEDFRAGKRSSANMVSDLFDLTLPVDDRAYDDAQEGVISIQEDVINDLTVKFPKYSGQIEESSAVIYDFYLKCRSSHDTPPGASAKTSQRARPPRAVKKTTTQATMPAADSFRFDRDGELYYRKPTGGTHTLTGLSVLSLRAGAKLPGGFTFFSRNVDDQGVVVQVIIKGPNDNKLNVPNIAS